MTDQLYAEIKPAVDGANYIIKHMRNKNDYNEVSGARRTRSEVRGQRSCLFCHVIAVPSRLAIPLCSSRGDSLTVLCL